MPSIFLPLRRRKEIYVLQKIYAGIGHHTGRGPALLLVLLLTCGLMALFLPAALYGLRGETLSALLGVYNWRQIAVAQDYFASIGAGSPFTHLWTLAVEVQFLLLWPLLKGLLQKGLKRDRESTAVLLGFSAVSLALLMPAAYLLTGSVSFVYRPFLPRRKSHREILHENNENLRPYPRTFHCRKCPVCRLPSAPGFRGGRHSLSRRHGGSLCLGGLPDPDRCGNEGACPERYEASFRIELRNLSLAIPGQLPLYGNVRELH